LENRWLETLSPLSPVFDLRHAVGQGNAAYYASQASDVGSIPIARSIKPDGSIGFTLLTYQNPTRKWTVLD